MKPIIISSLFMIIMISGCSRTYYDIVLKQVERPVEAKERYGESKITKIEEEEVKYYFEDEMVKIAWIPTIYKIGFILKNKTNHSIKIVWDEAVYVDEEGESHRVTHSGVKYLDRNNPQPPSVVIRKGSITDVIVPSDNIYYISGKGWKMSPLLPNIASSKFQEKTQEELMSYYLDKSVQVLLPLQIEDIINEYIFTFEIKNIETKGIVKSRTARARVSN